MNAAMKAAVAVPLGPGEREWLAQELQKAVKDLAGYVRCTHEPSCDSIALADNVCCAECLSRRKALALARRLGV